MWEVSVEGKQKYVSNRGREELMCAACRKQDAKANELVLLVIRNEGINCGGQEMMQDLEGLESW